MKKKWAGIVTILLTMLVLVATAAPVLAQSEGEKPDGARPGFKVGLVASSV